MLDVESRLVLVNAIYFKANWKYTFKEQFTAPKPFHVTSTDTVECQMMRIAGDFNFVANSELDAKVLELQYKSEGVSMILVLPNDVDGITELESKISNVNLSELIRSLSNCKVEVGVPRFKIETSMLLNDVLKKMGLEVAFDDRNANFSKIADSDEPLYISEVIQKAFIEVNEEGSEAAAVSGVLIKKPKSSHGIDVEKFFADHPFIFYVVVKHPGESLVNVIFSGRVMQFA
ncbi:hypothetical protein ILUMI_10821 [Ignelater luminosus]|uniref:Serpin domain-containing protein n=1 Tax=Ignelater luminosus TaxID=2038154 RepID=A0A8K0D1P3_IGNLU|nr:hypothetical protein ILUMI_10821 [Ignelater luminosus]